jgi:hypothetical protein
MKPIGDQVYRKPGAEAPGVSSVLVRNSAGDPSQARSAERAFAFFD